MLAWALAFLILSLISAGLLLSGTAVVSSVLIQVLFIGFLGLFAVTLIIGLARKPPHV
ncbi:MAG: DUF1328 domain-containing protein [Fibrobacter sp.]|nr:DUF1328 domain-containing protein [Fibrobacter sp.]